MRLIPGNVLSPKRPRLVWNRARGDAGRTLVEQRPQLPRPSLSRAPRRSLLRATAALEFAVASPLLVMTLGGAADYGLAQYYRANLSNAVAAGADYAYLNAQGVTAANIASTVTGTIWPNIQTVVTDVMHLPSGAVPNLSVIDTSAPATSGPGWYCMTVVSGVTTLTSSAAGGSCTSDGTTATAGYYITITATYTNTGIMNGFMSTVSQPMTESVTVRLQ